MYNGSAKQPDYPAALASLQHMDIDALKEILNDEDKFDNFIKELPQIKALDAEKEMLMTSNKSLAEYNLSQEPHVKEEKGKLLEKFQRAASLAETVKALKTDLDSKSGKMNPDSLLVLLEAASQEAEEESETMVDLFIDSQNGSLEEFLEPYKEKRKLAHHRRIKIDKMRELLAKKKQSVATPSRAAPPPPISNNSPGGPVDWARASNLPYPAVASQGFPGYPPMPSGYPPQPYPAYPQLPGNRFQNPNFR